jgi:hypothetical protein
MCHEPVPELCTSIFGAIKSAVLPAKTAAAIGDLQILPKQTIEMLSDVRPLSEEIKLWFIF